MANLATYQYWFRYQEYRSVEVLVRLVGSTIMCLVETPSTKMRLLVVHIKLAVVAKLDSVFDRVLGSNGRLRKLWHQHTTLLMRCRPTNNWSGGIHWLMGPSRWLARVLVCLWRFQEGVARYLASHENGALLHQWQKWFGVRSLPWTYHDYAYWLWVVLNKNISCQRLAELIQD